MTTLELKASLIQEFTELLENEENLKKLQRYMRRLRRNSYAVPKEPITTVEEELAPYTLEELNARIDASIAAAKAGRVISTEEINQEMEEFISSSSRTSYYPKEITTVVEEDLTPYTMEELNARIDESEADIEAGRVISSEEMRRRRNRLISSL